MASEPDRSPTMAFAAVSPAEAAIEPSATRSLSFAIAVSRATASAAGRGRQSVEPTGSVDMNRVSFRGASAASEPGIHAHGATVVMDSSTPPARAGVGRNDEGIVFERDWIAPLCYRSNSPKFQRAGPLR